VNFPYPFGNASDVRANPEGAISLVDDQGKALVRIPMNTAFELSPEAEGDGYGGGFGYGDSYGGGFGYGADVGGGSGDGYGSGDSYGGGFGSGDGYCDDVGDGSGSGRSK
jgi:hypothetical protein